MNEQIHSVVRFMETFGQTVHYQPVTQLAPRDRALRVNLLLEKLQKLSLVLGTRVGFFVEPKIETNEIEPEKALDVLVDILYVTFGCAATLGLQDYLEAAFAEVHKANLSKVCPDGKVIRNYMGKVVKGPNFKRANLRAVLAKEPS